jgi:formamidopyrimidine-DNA glycosylase
VPELPEVESTARSLRPRLVGERISGVSGLDWTRMAPNTSEADLDSTLRGRTVRSVDRRGKYLLIGFDADVWLAVHRKMSGNLLLQAANTPREAHTHLVVALESGAELRLVDARKFGRVYLFHSTLERDDFLSARLGPDSLVELNEGVLAARLRRRKGRVKSLLLDQAFLAGVGNLYADEALWEARVHPLRSADSLSNVEVKRLAQAIQHVLVVGIERRGTSFSTYRDSDGRPGENQGFLNVYGRAGLACPRCGTPISRILIGQRSSHFCSKCQLLRAGRARAPRAQAAANSLVKRVSERNGPTTAKRNASVRHNSSAIR